MAESDAAPEADGYQRRGRVFTLRLRDDLRMLLEQSHQQARHEIPWEFRRSLGGFLVWAALQWKPTQQALPNGRSADGTVRRNGQVVARRVKPKRALRAKPKAKGKKARR